MSITKEVKQEIIKKFALKDGDVGSPEVQIAILTERIKNITAHLKNHKHDNHTKYGLMGLINRRRKLLDYLDSREHERYSIIIKKLSLRR